MISKSCVLRMAMLENSGVQVKGYMFSKNSEINLYKFGTLVSQLYGHYEALQNR